MRGLLRFASIALAVACTGPGGGLRAGVRHRCRQGHLRRGVARRHGRSLEPGAHREDAVDRHRRVRPLSDHLSCVPGTYTVTFTLTGFSTFKRDGLELTGSFVATINADMKVGAVAETITVTGETPLVDVQSAAVQKVVTKEVVDAIPTGRLGINLAALQPGIILGAGGSVGGANTNALGVAGRRRHGGRHVHRPRDSRRQAGRAAPDDRRPVGGDDDSLRRVAEQLAQLHRDAGDVGQHVGRRRLDGRRRRADQLRAPRRRQHVQGPDVLLRREQRRCRAPTTRAAAATRRAPARRSRASSAAACVAQPGALSARLRLQPRLRRSDQEGQAVVLRDGALDRGQELRPERLSEQELRRRHDAARRCSTPRR